MPPYTVLADVYEFMMTHVNYRQWAEYIDSHLHRLHISRGPLLDISCGTGSFCRQIARKGYLVWGFDMSYKMVHVARKQSQGTGLFWCGSMTQLSCCRRVPVVVSLYDSMNYLLEEQEWIECLQQVYRILTPGGVFIFDVSTISNSVDYFNDFEQQEKSRHMRYIRRSHFDAKAGIQWNRFEIHLLSEPGVVYCENHRQRIRYLDEIAALIKQTPFQLAAYYNGFTFREGNESSDRVHYILKKN